MELNQIILKRLLESKLSEAKRVEEHKGWTYWEMPNGYDGPWEAKHYYKEYPGDIYVAIYPPQELPYEGHVDSWAVSISDGSPDIDEYGDEFDSFKQAEEYVNTWIESHDITESVDSASVDDIVKYDRMKSKSAGDKDKQSSKKTTRVSDLQTPGEKEYLPADPQDDQQAKRREMIKLLFSTKK